MFVKRKNKKRHKKFAKLGKMWRKSGKKGITVAKNRIKIYNKGMKKIISVALVAMLIVTTALTFTGCIFNSGAESEVYGVYGVDRMFYNAYTGEKYNYADKFDYYLLILNKDSGDVKTGKVILKPTDGEEVSYDIHFTLEFDEENSKVVKTVVVKDFRLPTYVDSGEYVGRLSFTEPTEAKFTLYPKREDLTYRITPAKIDGGLKTSKNLLEFHKISNKTTDKKIERAKNKQTKSREKRNDSNDD